MTAKTLLQSAGDGTAVPEKKIGEKITWATPPSDVSGITGTSYVDWANATITLSEGTWAVFANVCCLIQTATTAGNSAYIVIAITDSADNIVENQERQLYIVTPAAASAKCQSSISHQFIKTVSSSTPYKIRYKIGGSAAGSAAVYNSATQYSYFYAVRIA